MTSGGSRIRHQLTIWLDYMPSDDDAVEVNSGYPHSAPHDIPQQRIRFPRDSMTPEAKAALDAIDQALLDRVAAKSVRLPSRSVRPSTRRAYTTIVIQDQTRSGELPIARLYYDQQIRQTGTSVNDEVRMESGDFSSDELRQWQTLRGWAKRVAWEDYNTRFEVGSEDS